MIEKSVKSYFFQRYKQVAYDDYLTAHDSIITSLSKIFTQIKNKIYLKRHSHIRKSKNSQKRVKEYRSNPRNEGEDNIDTTKIDKDNAITRSFDSEKNEMTEKERFDFIKRMKKEREKAQILHQTNIENINAKILQKIQEEHKSSAEKERKRAEEKQKNITKIKNKVESDRIERKKLLLIENKDTYEDSKPLYKKLEDRFFSNSVMPEMEKQKEILARQKEFYRPIKFDEINKHELEYKRAIKESEILRKHKLSQNYYDLAQHQASINYYKSPLLDIMMIESEEKIQKEAEKSESSKVLAHKAREYGKLAIDLFKPKISYNKQLEIEWRRRKIRNDRLNKSIDENMINLKPYDVKSAGDLRGHSKNLENVDSKILSSNPGDSIKSYKSSSHKRNLQPSKRSSSISSRNDTSPDTSVNKSVDYLLQKRVERQKSRDHGSPLLKPVNWTQILSDENTEKSAKINKIKLLTQSIELRAQNYERSINPKHIKNIQSLEIQDSINNVYIDSIKAKLAVLDSL
ncbi:unnamed protein product [Blepharisma stoltei]|uniref:Uncharacterized protein n=1 Tax=Blepharisma stoltei TaxID=1481888 RepID=A0AAU9IZD7_9CILI|nr:unnamed protein product [Blepharisma stoltei]